MPTHWHAACIFLAAVTHQVASVSIPKPATNTTFNGTLTWPADGQPFPIPGRTDISLIFEDIPAIEDVGSGIPAVDIQNSAETYITQLQRLAANPFRGVNFPLGDRASGEQDCRITGTVYAVRPVKLNDGHWNFSIQDTIDVLKGIEAVAIKQGGVQESDVRVVGVKGNLIAQVKVLSQFRGTEPSTEKCLNYVPGSVQEIATS